jgi:glycogen(starch) synthase
MQLLTSIVICTDGRPDSLKMTLESLRFLNQRKFEVCVVCGPTEDGTRELVSAWPNPLKIVFNSERNLSISRNIGIRNSAGDIVAFLDDDSIPEPEWLDQILAAYKDPSVGGAGGFVFNHTGMNFQWKFGTTDRLGNADMSWKEAAPELNFPFSYNFPHLLGANSTFRRTALIEVGGFDEEFDYFLDETDLICRIVDNGLLIRQLCNAFVHHKHRASHLRNEANVLRVWYPTLKNKLYYGLIHRHGYHSVHEVIEHWFDFVQTMRETCDWAVYKGFLLRADRERFEKEADQALADGLQRGMNGKVRTMSPEQARAPAPAFLPYSHQSRRGESKTYVLLTREYGPGPVGGGALHVGELAKGLAELGHQVHVVTCVDDVSRVDFEDGVWVHRLVVPSELDEVALTSAGPVPKAIWASTSFREHYIAELALRKAIDAVYALIWDCEGAALLRAKRFPVVLGLQTTFALWLNSHSEKSGNEKYMREFGRPMLALEREMILQSHAVHAISNAIRRDVETAYQVSLSDDRSAVIPLGIADASKERRAPIAPRPQDIDVRLLFAGRLEARKGIDVLLAVAPRLLREFTGLQIDIVGNDRIEAADGSNYRAEFEAANENQSFARRVVFHGEVASEALRAFYADCDVYVSPSRYESFGLVFVEAMTFAKPVVGCRIGGMVEVIANEDTGLLAAPEDAESLYAALRRLIVDPELRARMGAAGRDRYERLFRREIAARGVSDLMERARNRWEQNTLSEEAVLAG